MKYLSILLFIATLIYVWGQSSKDEFLFQIIEHNKVGYINSKGQVVIKPIFLSAGEFSEGLAPARIGGTYGYIDKTGSFLIQPQFDYATPFREGLAVVYLDGQPFFINKKGQKAIDCEFPIVNQFNNGKAFVRTFSKKWGIIDKQGIILIDTVFSDIHPFVDGLAVVEGLNHHPFEYEEKGIKRNYEIGVIDSLGKFLIPYGKYEDISDYEDGYFRVQIAAETWDSIQQTTQKTGFVDKYGNLVLSRDQSRNISIKGNIHCGLASMNLYRYWIPENNVTSYNGDLNYEGYINLKGEIAIQDSTFRHVEDFANNRAFVKVDDNLYSLINTKGELIAKNAYDNIMETGFDNGVAFVAVDSKWGLIDTNANFIIKPQFDEIDRIGMRDDYFFFLKNIYDKNGGYHVLTGICKKDGTILYEPILENYDRDGFINGILACIINDKSTYINIEGKIIWQEPDIIPEPITHLNIDFMNRGYFYAYSKPIKYENGGFGQSENKPKKITKLDNFKSNGLEIIVRPEIKDTIFDSYYGISVFVANASNNRIDFNAQDSRLKMKVQALNPKNEWCDIEYLPSSWCGNSYHTLRLEPQYFWTFITPIYEGDFKTKLRIELKYLDPNGTSEETWEKKENTIYSNEFEGSVNPGQFWRKSGYSPQGVMDPYND